MCSKKWILEKPASLSPTREFSIFLSALQGRNVDNPQRKLGGTRTTTRQALKGRDNGTFDILLRPVGAFSLGGALPPVCTGGYRHQVPSGLWEGTPNIRSQTPNREYSPRLMVICTLPCRRLRRFDIVFHKLINPLGDGDFRLHAGHVRGNGHVATIA